MPFTAVDGTWHNGVTFDAGELRRADSAIFAGLGTSNEVRGGIVMQTSTSLAVTVDGSDVVTVQAGAVVIPGNAVAGTGPYRCSLGASQTQTLLARDATNPRIDLVCFRALDTDVVGGHAAKHFIIDIIEGTPSATPAVPALPTMAVELGRITVPQTGGGAASVDLTNRTFVSAIGGTLLVTSSSKLPATGTPYATARTLDNGTEYIWTGAAWRMVGGVQSGTSTVELVAQQSNFVDVTFTAAYVVAPKVTAASAFSDVPIGVSNVTTSGCRLTVYRILGAATISVGVTWMAHGQGA